MSSPGLFPQRREHINYTSSVTGSVRRPAENVKPASGSAPAEESDLVHPGYMPGALPLS